jgi:hypothetical protein
MRSGRLWFFLAAAQVPNSTRLTTLPSMPPPVSGIGSAFTPTGRNDAMPDNRDDTDDFLNQHLPG